MKDIVVTPRDERETIARHPKSIVALEDEIESLRARLAEVTSERDEYAERRCEVCGYAEHHREHTGCLRKQLAEVTSERDAFRSLAEGEPIDAYQALMEDFLAAQAHIARLAEALKAAEYGDGRFDHRGNGQRYCPECGEKKGCAHSQNCIIGKALSTPINLDALYEDRARECERLANVAGDEPEHVKALFSEWLREEADTHRAKKEGNSDLTTTP